MTLSDNLKEKVIEVRRNARLLNLLDRNMLLNNLVYCYHVINRTEELMRYGISKSKGDLKGYLTRHLEEETNHAKWLSEDLASAGVDVEKTEAPFAVKKMVDMQFKLVKENSANLLGYMAVLEGFPTPLEIIENLELVHGVDLMRTAKLHAVEDIEHGNDLWEVINKVDDLVVLDNAVRTAEYCNEISDCLGDC